MTTLEARKGMWAVDQAGRLGIIVLYGNAIPSPGGLAIAPGLEVAYERLSEEAAGRQRGAYLADVPLAELHLVGRNGETVGQELVLLAGLRQARHQEIVECRRPKPAAAQKLGYA